MDPLFDTAWTVITVARRDDIVEVALNRPAARNALDETLMAELTEAAHWRPHRPRCAQTLHASPLLSDRDHEWRVVGLVRA